MLLTLEIRYGWRDKDPNWRHNRIVSDQEQTISSFISWASLKWNKYFVNITWKLYWVKENYKCISIKSLWSCFVKVPDNMDRQNLQTELEITHLTTVAVSFLCQSRLSASNSEHAHIKKKRKKKKGILCIIWLFFHTWVEPTPFRAVDVEKRVIENA